MAHKLREKLNKSRAKREQGYEEYKLENYPEEEKRAEKTQQKVNYLTDMIFQEFKDLKNKSGILGKFYLKS